MSGFKLPRLNWPLLLGSLIVLLIAFLAVAGKYLAPRDPMEQIHLLRLEEGWDIPPYSPGAPGYPLGSDQYGRDLLSQVLWAVRPTFIMVLIVASVRLLLGVLIGLFSGWSRGGVSRALDLLTASALAIPALLVALAVIARVGIEEGLGVFILGLAVTGWAETAQVVRTQTESIREKLYIEASKAMGGNSLHLLRRHVLRQVMPMVWMLFAFEISATMLITGALGFLGFYMGGYVRIQVDDFITRRATSAPELGQMLATTLDITIEPFGMVVAGTMIFLIVLGFNLLGEGLRQRLGFEARRQTPLRDLMAQISLWFENQITYPVSLLVEKIQRPLQAAGALLVVTAVFWGGLRWWEARPPQAEPTHVAQSTEVEPATPTPQDLDISFTAQIAWSFEVPEGVICEPVINPDGSAYIYSYNGTLYALEADGSLRWQTTPDPQVYERTDFTRHFLSCPMGAEDGSVMIVSIENTVYSLAPDGSLQWVIALDTTPYLTWNFTSGEQAPYDWWEGVLYLQDERGVLYAIDPVEGLLWKYTPDLEQHGAHSRLAFASDGTVYYSPWWPPDRYLAAISPEGETLWFIQLPENDNPSYMETPQIGPEEKIIFIQGSFVNAQDGAILDLLLPEGAVSVMIDPHDGALTFYDSVSDELIEFIITEQGVEILGPYHHPLDPAQLAIREFYTAMREEYDHIDDDPLTGLSYWCKSQRDPVELTCLATSPDREEPLWEVTVAGVRGIKYAALSLDLERLYIFSGEKIFYAIDLGESEVAQDDDDEPAPQGALGLSGAPEILWDTQLPDGVFELPIISEDGWTYLYNDDGLLLTFNPQGNLELEMTLDPEPHRYEVHEFNNNHYETIAPIPLPDQSLLVIAKEWVYALDRQGAKLWEEPLDASPLPYLLRGPGGEIIVEDKRSNLYTFNAQGLVWKFDPGENLRYTDNPFVLVGDAIYYTVTDLTVGYVQAVSLEGEGLWLSEPADSFKFHRRPVVLFDGALVMLDEDLYDGADGTHMTLEIPEGINIFGSFAGEDGRVYFHSLSEMENLLFEWEIQEGRVEIVRQILVPFGFGNLTFTYPRVFLDGSIMWMVNNMRLSELDFYWTDSEGRLTGHIHIPDNHDSWFLGEDYSAMMYCGRNREADSYDCFAITPEADAPVWQFSFSAFSRVRTISFNSRTGKLAVITTDNQLYFIDLADD